MPESTQAKPLTLYQRHRHKRHETREMQFQLERIANLLEKDEPLPPSRKEIVIRTLRSMAKFMEAEYEEHTRACAEIEQAQTPGEGADSGQ